MIEVTCGACGAVQQVADADIPPDGKSVTCASCKSRIAVPGSRPTVSGIGRPGGLSAALPDLPAPRRPSPLANAGATRPIPKSPLAGAEDLPAPKSAGKPEAARADAVGSGPTRTTGAEDLPAPKRAPVPAIPPPISADGADLVAPKRSMPPIPSGRPTVPAIPPMMKAGGNTAMGMPATRAPAPAPVSPPVAPPASASDIDLDDLLAPVPGKPDLPAPKRAGEVDLPAPKRPVQPDLPAPKRPSEIADLPQPKGTSDLPAPKGFFDDLPQPAANQPNPQSQQGSTDLPAPKGFFDDLPQPALTGKPELPAPKGFFDDIPQVAKHQTGLPQPARSQTGLPQPVGPGAPPLVTPPGRGATAPTATRPAAPPPMAGDRAHKPSGPPPTADDLFNDLTPPPVMTTPPALDLDDLDLGPAGDAAPPPGVPRAKTPSASGTHRTAPGAARAPAARASSTLPPSASGTRSTEDSDVDGQALPMLDLGDGDRGHGADFGGVDLPPVTVGPAAGAGSTGVSFKAGKGSKPGGHEPMALGTAGEADLALDVDDAKAPLKRSKRTSTKSPKTRTKKAERVESNPRRTRIVLLVLLVLLAGGAAGYWLWQRHKKAAEHAADLDKVLAEARVAMVAGTPGHWRVAQTKAQQVFDASSKNAEAAGLAAESAYASIFDDGQNAEQQAKIGASILTRALGAGLAGPDLDKAQGLKLVVDGQAKRALDTYLDPVAKRAPTDGNAALFQGWGRVAAGDYAGAIESFDRSAKALPKRDLPALLGRARAKLAAGDRAGARADFTAVLAKDKTHIGAQVGLAASASTPAEVSQREKDLAVLLQSKDIDKADPRAVAMAYTIAGDDSRRTNRFDIAREHYRKAIQKAPLETAPLCGLAELELREGKLDDAAELVAKAVKLAPDRVDVVVVAGELAVKQGKLDAAEVALTKLRDLKPTGTGEKTRVQLFAGALYEAQNKPDDALDAYMDAIKVADPYDVAPPLAAATLLGKMATAQPERAGELRAKADAVLAPLEEKAGAERSIAVALGVGYLAAGDSAKAERWLRNALQSKSDDIDALFQLAEALARQGKNDEALASLRRAFEIDTSRVDVGIQLARRYEESNRNDDAASMYDQLLAGKDVTLDLRARAGKFYARVDKIEKARLQGEEIVKVDEENPAGQYLKGLGLFADGKLEDARRLLHAATETEKDAQYLDAYGQVCEALESATKDGRYRDEALRAYQEASKADPTLLNPLAGMGRLYISSGQRKKAEDPLQAALKLAPDDADIQFSLGLVEYETKPDEAIKLLVASVKTKPRSLGFHNLGMLYDNYERYALAEAALSRATEMGQTEENSGATVTWLTDSYYSLGRNAADLRHWAVARKAWQAYLDRNPTDVVKVDKIKRELLRMPR